VSVSTPLNRPALPRSVAPSYVTNDHQRINNDLSCPLCRKSMKLVKRQLDAEES
jgi:hypothetical protein